MKVTSAIVSEPLVITALLFSATVGAQTSTQTPAQTAPTSQFTSGTFEERLALAKSKSGNYWLGWSIERWADSQRFGQSGNWQWHGNWSGNWGGYSGNFWGSGKTQFRGRPLSLVLPSGPSPAPANSAGQSPGADWELRPLAVLIAMEGNSVRRVIATDFQLPVNLGDQPLRWLGVSSADQSVGELERLDQQLATQHLRQSITQAVSQHTGGEALAMLTRLLDPATTPLTHPDIRRDAAEGLGYQQAPQVPALLRQLILNDAYQDVRKAALQGLRWQRSATATRLLKALAEGSLESSVQPQALRLLADTGGSIAAEVLATVIWSDQGIGTQAAAAGAIARLPAELGGPLAVRAAHTHPQAKVREEAVEALASLKVPQALAILRQIVTNDDDYKVQETALEALAELPLFQGLSTIAKIAHTHPDQRLREEAIETLGDLGEEYPPAREALLTLIGV